MAVTIEIGGGYANRLECIRKPSDKKKNMNFYFTHKIGIEFDI